MMFWLHLAEYAALICLVVSTTLGLLILWNDSSDERKVRKLRKELELLDSELFLHETNDKKS